VELLVEIRHLGHKHGPQLTVAAVVVRVTADRIDALLDVALRDRRRLELRAAADRLRGAFAAASWRAVSRRNRWLANVDR
jgi:hypothetical protein